MKSENVKMKTRTDYRAKSVKQMSTVHTRVDKDLPTGFFFYSQNEIRFSRFVLKPVGCYFKFEMPRDYMIYDQVYISTKYRLNRDEVNKTPILRLRYVTSTRKKKKKLLKSYFFYRGKH